MALLCQSSLSVSAAEVEPTVGLYEVYEVQVTNSNTYDNPFDYREIELQASFTAPSGREAPFFGFFDGDGQGEQAGAVWKLRFMPDETGRWTFTYHFSDGSHAGSGSFNVVDKGHPGPLRVAADNPHFFANARGEPFHWRGYDLRYFHPAEGTHLSYRGDAVDGYIEVIKSHVLPQDYNFVMLQTPSLLTLEGDEDFGSWWYQEQKDHFDVRVWGNFERIVQFALAHEVYLMPFDGAVAQPNADYLTPALLRYMAARLGPYASMLGYSPTWEYHDVFGEKEVGRFMSAFSGWFPEHMRPLLSVHDRARCEFAAWQDFHMRQGGDNHVTASLRQANDRSIDVQSGLQPYNRPIIGSEDIWESPGAMGQRFRYAQTGEQVRRTAWAEMLAGVLPLYSEWNWFMQQDDPSRLGNGDGEAHVRRMFDFFYERTRYRHYRQLNSLVDVRSGQFASGIPGVEYLIYVSDGGEIQLDLSREEPERFNVLWFDPASGNERQGEPLLAGQSLALKAPFTGEAVLLLTTQTADPHIPALSNDRLTGTCQSIWLDLPWVWMTGAGLFLLGLVIYWQQRKGA